MEEILETRGLSADEFVAEIAKEQKRLIELYGLEVIKFTNVDGDNDWSDEDLDLYVYGDISAAVNKSLNKIKRGDFIIAPQSDQPHLSIIGAIASLIDNPIYIRAETILHRYDKLRVPREKSILLSSFKSRGTGMSLIHSSTLLDSKLEIKETVGDAQTYALPKWFDGIS